MMESQLAFASAIDATDLSSTSLTTRLQQLLTDNPDAPCLSFIDDELEVVKAWSRRDLDRESKRVAGFIRGAGLANTPIVLAFPSGLEFVAAFLGCLYAGAIAVPASLPRTHGFDERLGLIVADCGAGCVLTSSRQLDLIEKHLRNDGMDLPVIATDTLPAGVDDLTPITPAGDDIAFLQYTSGSTRSPRGVMVTHRNLATNLRLMQEVFGTTDNSVGLVWLPLFHDMGLIAGTLLPLWTGFHTYFMAPATFLQSPIRWVRAISKYRATITAGPNFGYQACIDSAQSIDVTSLDLSSWLIAGNGAEPVRADTLTAFSAAFAGSGFQHEALTPGYGLAEATLAVSSGNGNAAFYEITVDENELRNGNVIPCKSDHPNLRTLVSSGRPVAESKLLIVDPDSQQVLAPGRVGEIWIQNACVGKGYWNKPAETDETFGARIDGHEGTFLRTGDLGFFFEDELFVSGRLKDVIVIRGANFYPHDIEHTIETAHPALRHDGGVVVGLEDEGRVRLVSVHEVRREVWRSVNAEEVVDAVRRAVARDHQLTLHGVLLLKPLSLPKTTSGKVQRAETRNALAAGSLSAIHEWWAPPTVVAPIQFSAEPLEQVGVLERQLLTWLKAELALSDLTWSTPLMDLGIDSLKGVELGSALSVAFNHSFSPTLLIDYPSIEALSAHIRSDVLGVKTDVEAPTFTPAKSTATTLDEKAISALNDDELDRMLANSIDEVLGRNRG